MLIDKEILRTQIKQTSTVDKIKMIKVSLINMFTDSFQLYIIYI